MTARKPFPSLPAAIATYWAEANAGRAASAAACFADDAEVHDEGHTHRGPAAIQTWIEETARKYQPQVEPLRVAETDGRLLVGARVSGGFPGSPVELDFVFTLRAGRIATMTIS